MFLLFNALSHPTLGVPDQLAPRWRFSYFDPSLLRGFGLRRVDYLARASCCVRPKLPVVYNLPVAHTDSNRDCKLSSSIPSTRAANVQR